MAFQTGQSGPQIRLRPGTRRRIGGVPRVKLPPPKNPASVPANGGTVSHRTGAGLVLALFTYDRGDLGERLTANPLFKMRSGRIPEQRWRTGSFWTRGGRGISIPVLLISLVAPVLSRPRVSAPGWRAPLAALGPISLHGMLDLFSGDLPRWVPRGSAPSAGGFGSQLNSRIGRVSAQPTGGAGLYRALHRQPNSPDRFCSSWLRSDACLFGLPRPKGGTVWPEKASLDKEARRPGPGGPPPGRARCGGGPLKKSSNWGDSVRTSCADRKPRGGLGPDLQPVPEPRFQDNSLSNFPAPPPLGGAHPDLRPEGCPDNSGNLRTTPAPASSSASSDPEPPVSSGGGR